MNKNMFKVIKKYTLILAVMYTLYSTMFIISSISIQLVNSFGLSSADLVALGMSNQVVYMMYILTIIYIVVTILLYIWHSKLKRKVAVSKILYFAIVMIEAFNIINMFISGMDTYSYILLIINGITALLAILVIISLFMLEEDQESNSYDLYKSKG